MVETASRLIGDRYQLQSAIRRGGMGEVYRAFDRMTRETVALKRVTARSESLEFASRAGDTSSDFRLALAHEFQILASVRHPHIISVLDYGFDDAQQPYFTMTLLDDPCTITEAARGQSQTDQIRLLVEMLQALAYLHRQGIIHRDLKPDNALVTQEGQVKVLDFGLAMVHGQRIEEENETAGTLAYMAPEVLQGDPASEGSDLYAVGIMAYEMLVGRHPFRTENLSDLVNDILLASVDFSTIDLQPALVEVLAGLVVRDPDKRRLSAEQVCAALCEAIDAPLPEETEAIRESFLQAAQFVGREAELEQLTTALSQADQGRGSLWLIGGENGVGKSRLLAELRSHALVSGALVVYGQGVAEGGLPYQLWREPLRRLALSVQVDDTTASVLKTIVPDIPDLLGRTVPDAPELEGGAGKQRLFRAIAGLFTQTERLIVVILEDLQWAVESLDFLQALAGVIPDRRLLVVGSYRDDEKPDFPQDLPSAQVLKLDRLDEDGIARLSVSMLGDVGRQPEVIGLLQRETEGNVFFLVEVVRALAEQAGQLSGIGSMTLPAQVFAGGVNQIVERRLRRVPPAERALLNVAAVTGRLLDLKVLRAVAPDTDLEHWMTVCANMAVIDVYDGQWRFAHDKLRDGLLSAMDPDERRTLHGQVAPALEAAYSDALDAYAATIADHYERAGVLDRAAHWYLQAGKHAFKTYVPATAAVYYQKVLNFLATELSTSGERAAWQIEALEGLGHTLYRQARYQEALEAFSLMRAAAEAAHDRVALATSWYGAAVVQIYQGNLQEAYASASEAEQIARAEDARPVLARALWMKGWSAFRQGDAQQALPLGEQVVALGEELDNPGYLANGLNLLGAVYFTLGNYSLAAEHFERGLALYQELDDRGNAMALLNNLGWLAGAMGEYETARARYQNALAVAQAIGNRDAEMVYRSNLGGALVGLSEFEEAESHLTEVIAAAEQVGLGELSEMYRFLGEARLGRGKIDSARTAALHALELGQGVGSPEYVAAAWRVLGRVAARQGVPIQVPDGEAVLADYEASACFAESDRVCGEAGLDGERAHTLRAWARHALLNDESAEGQRMWDEARAIFTRLGAQAELRRMHLEQSERAVQR